MNYSPNPSNKKELDNLDRDELLVTAQRLLAETQAISVRISAVNEIATAINRSLNLDEILRVVGKQAKWLLDFEHLSVYLLKNDSGRFIKLAGNQVEFEESIIAENNCFHKALKGQSQLVKQAKSKDFLSQYASQIILPLESFQKILGVIFFGSSKPQAYNQEDLRIGYLLALQLSSAIRNANSFEDLNLLNSEIEKEKQKSERLLLNILPSQIAEEIKRDGRVKPVYHPAATILFTDFENFSMISKTMTPEDLVDELDYCFSSFDQIIEKYHLEKLKTIGDSYMCCGGIPTPSSTHAFDVVMAALQIQQFMELRRQQKMQQCIPYWNTRIGIHSGSLLSGVIGKNKFVYDVWGDTVNLASRMESSGVAGQINISRATFELVKDFFEVAYRGKILAKNMGQVDMYLIKGIKE
ncbi:MAG: adenylate cyclase [Pseudanabaena frigida]|uniref:Adenylate cyclase n=1 Tax=Pseudanabaena frigida TaxID=945775 RepID=A0A2W4WBB0_9CYAN|nr:MAG: adenylate cyclase [Pseudanabaena frigida]